VIRNNGNKVSLKSAPKKARGSLALDSILLFLEFVRRKGRGCEKKEGCEEGEGKMKEREIEGKGKEEGKMERGKEKIGKEEKRKRGK